MSNRDILEQLAVGFELGKLIDYFKRTNLQIRPLKKDFPEILASIKDPRFDTITQVGEIEYDNANRLGFYVCPLRKDLTEKTSKKIQYEIGKKILKADFYDAGIFVFYGKNGSFRLSLIAASYLGPKREFTTFRRYTYYVSPELTNKTFKSQLGKCRFSSIENILEAFSIEAVSEEFYNTFKPKFDKIVSSIQDGKINMQTKQDFALLFAIRIIFLGFVEKKGWLGEEERFLRSFWEKYQQHKRKSHCQDEFYTRWLEPLFFESLNSPPGTPVRPNNNEFSQKTEKLLQMAPYLNGELFKRKQGVDDRGYYLPDEIIGEYFEFLFQYNFTIDENTAYDEELELNPEFLGIIFERFVNKDMGAVYTPRTEVDFMCRLSLLRWLERKGEFDPKELHHLFFREGGKGSVFEEDQKDGNFSTKEIRSLLECLENVSICDPAAGSGAFEVGMLHVINDTIEKLYRMPHFPGDVERKAEFERKKGIIARSLYGVEVQDYAVWINQLRLWLTLFIDMPDEMKHSQLPLLPSLNFKIRRGDSLVQRIGKKMFPVDGHAAIKDTTKRKITELKKAKVNFFNNEGFDEKALKKKEVEVFLDIIDAQIKDHQDQLRSQDALKHHEQKGFSFFQQDIQQLNLAQQKKVKLTREKIESELSELKTERQSLSEDHLLVWNIEFAEIFYDKGGFDIIIGNPPYVRQEEITDPEGKVEPKEYKELLCRMAELDYPKYFEDRKIDGKSDLYTFFYLRSLHLLNKDGVHCFICSNSWLDVGYGVWMQEFLLENVPVDLIIDNHARRSFSSADVNTIISLFDAPDKNYNRDQHLVKFVAFKKAFEECIFTENLWQLHEANQIIKNGIFRVYPIIAEKLYDEGWEVEEGAKKETGKYIGDKWGGKYLKAPDIFFNILEKGKESLIKLNKVADVLTIAWSRLGKNSEIILNKTHWPQKGKTVPLFKSPRDVEKILILESDTKYLLLLIDGVIKNVKYAPILWGDLKDKKYVCHYCRDKVAFAHSFHGIKSIRNDVSNVTLCAILNSSLIWLFSETLGRSGLGEGATRILVEEMKHQFFILSPFKVDAKKIHLVFDKISNRTINNVFIECGIDPESKIPIEEQGPQPLPDRKELDDIVFDALDLTAEERTDVYRGVCRLVWNRISKAKSV